MRPTGPPPAEKPIPALVPSVLDGPRPQPAPQPALPASPPRHAPQDWLLGIARPDASGRVTEQDLLLALTWSPGCRVDIKVRNVSIVVSAATAGRHAIGIRGEIPLPVAARRMCAFTPGEPLVLAADVALSRLIVQSARSVAQLLADLDAPYSATQ
ncbi:hypothetical protein Lfu02_36270 [Longispora fulva]|nr:hypothetical protein Lfu02_36270 [Longispora fulva]